MVLVSNLVTMQQTTHRHAALDESEYVHLPRPTAAASPPSPQPPPSSSSTQLQQHSNLVNGFHHSGPGSYRSSSLTRTTTNGNSSRNNCYNNNDNDNDNNPSTHRQRNLRPSSAIIHSQQGINIRHDRQSRSIQSNNSTTNNGGVSVMKQPSAIQDSINHNKRSSTTSLNFNHENLFYQPSIHNEVVENDLHTDPFHINDDQHHRNNHQQRRPHSYHHQQQQQHQNHHHRHQSPSTSHSSSSHMSHEHFSSSHPVKASRPFGLQLQNTFPPSSSSSSSSRPATLPRPSQLISSSKSSSSSSANSQSRHPNTSTLTRSSGQHENGHPADSNVISRRGDPITHAPNTPLTSPVNHRDTMSHTTNSSQRSNGDKTHQDAPYHYRPSSLIDVGQDNKSPEVEEKNGRDQTIDFAMKSGYFNKNGRITNSRNENNSKFETNSTSMRSLSGSAKSVTKSKLNPKNSTEDSPTTSGLSAVLDIPMSSITNADSWSPSYIKMDFFIRNGDSSSSSTNSSPASSSGFPSASTSSNHMWKSALRNGYKSHILSNSFDSSASTQSSSRILENGHGSHDSSQENISRSDNSSSSSRPEEFTTHHARLLTISRSSMDLRNSSPSGVTPVLDSVCGTLPQKVKSQFLRRSVSHEPREVQTTHPVIRTSSDGEIESEYVTLDHSYIPLNNSGLCRVNEIVVEESSKPPQPSLTVLPTTTTTNTQLNPKDTDCVVKTVSSDKNKKIKRIHNPVFTNEDSNIKLDVSNSMSQALSTTNLVNPKRSMRQQLLKMNSFPESLRRQIKGKNNKGNLRTVAENDASNSFTTPSSATPNVTESFFTLPRNRRSYTVDARSSPSSTHSVDIGYRGPADKTDSSRPQPQSQYPLHAMPTPMPKSILIRSKSLPDLQQADDAGQFVDDDYSDRHGISNYNSTVNNSNNFYSDDEDGDEFGFLSYPISFSSSSSMSSSTVMQKAKSPSPSSRILPKRWRTTKAKAVPGVTSCAAMWTPGPLGSCMWSSMSGRKVVLRPVSILSLSEAERIALQKVAYSKLQEMSLDCPVVIPKDATDVRRSKKSALSLKRRSKSVSLSPNTNNGKDSSGLVFGIPITKCIKNDRETEKKRWKMASAAAAAAATTTTTTTTTTTASAAAAAASASAATKSRAEWTENATTPRSTRKSSSSSQGSLEKSGSPQNGMLAMPRQDTLTVPSYKRAASSDSLSESESSRNTSSSLIDALSLSASCPTSRLSSVIADRTVSASQGELQVPNLVNTCFKHIQTYGLQTLGIFRVGCSKKRVKELREEFDSGKDVELTDEYHPHDVGALLKEYFRDLPEPLLTRELYLPFLHAKRLTNEHKRSAAIQLLISMLPVANRDTLWSLLQFLATVSQHAGDSLNEKGEKLPGNKMDSHNLATLFGPNILHRTRSMDKDHGMESAESVVESKEVIEVVKEMVECNHELYEISGSLRDDVLRLIVETDQESADRILKQLANQNQIEADPESMCSVFEDSTGSPVLSHAMNSDADFFAYAKRQTSASQRPLRVTKSVEDNLDSPVSKSRATHFSDSYANSSSHDLKIPPSNTHPCIHQDMVMGYHSPLPTRIPILQLPHDSSPEPSATEVVLRSRMDLSSSGERPYSESFSQNLSIPRPIYLRESSNSSVSSCLSSSQNSHRDSDGNNHSGYWALPTPPASRGTSPKPLIRSSSSSSTLIPSPSPAKLGYAHSEDYYDTKQPQGSPEWEKERWRHWELMASEKRNAEAEQETLV